MLTPAERRLALEQGVEIWERDDEDEICEDVGPDYFPAPEDFETLTAEEIDAEHRSMRDYDYDYPEFDE
jgi:hypothetical protein